jgi:hypothetical protein
MTLPLAVALQRIEVMVAAILICAAIFELIRRRHLMERYALLWLLAGMAVFVLAVWRGLLTTVSGWVGIYYPPAALFAAGFVFVLIMLLHFSITISRLSDQNKILAQRVALLRQRLEKLEGAERTAEGDRPALVADRPENESSHAP